MLSSDEISLIEGIELKGFQVVQCSQSINKSVGVFNYTCNAKWRRFHLVSENQKKGAVRDIPQDGCK